MIDSLSTLDIHLPGELGNKLSFSALAMFSDCPACFERAYLLHEPRRVHIALPKGTAIHEAMKQAGLRAMNGEALSEEEALDAARQSFAEEVANTDPALLDLGSTAYEKADDAVDDVVLLTKAFLRLVQEEARLGILAVEARVDFESLNWPFAFDAYVDTIVRGQERPIQRDRKTATKAGEPDALARLQSRIYRLPWHRRGREMDGILDRGYLKTDRALGCKRAVIEHFAVDASPIHYDAAEGWVLQNAAAISTGIYPARPSWKCKFPHPESD